MKTLELKVSDNLLDRVLHVLHEFPESGVRVIQKDNQTASMELQKALRSIQSSARKAGLDQMSEIEIDSEIAAVRHGL